MTQVFGILCETIIGHVLKYRAHGLNRILEGYDYDPFYSVCWNVKDIMTKMKFTYKFLLIVILGA